MNIVNNHQIKLLFIISFFLTEGNAQLNTGLDILNTLSTLIDSLTPTTVTEEDVTFVVYTNANRNGTELTLRNLTAVDPRYPLKFIIHGWTENAQRQWYYNFINAYLSIGEFNVIAVDWSGPAMDQYQNSVVHTRTVGAIIGQLIVNLNNETNVPLENVHLLGHSLGGQIAGYAGKQVIDILGQRIGRITGMDPAGPLYEIPVLLPRTQRLSSDDADLVDVVHTDSGVFGMATPIGSINFYPNGGRSLQPGCTISEAITMLPSLDGSSNTLENLINVNSIVFCSHIRSHQYYVETITQTRPTLGYRCNTYTAYQLRLCDFKDVVPFGEYVTPNVTGSYYFQTNSTEPYLNS